MMDEHRRRSLFVLCTLCSIIFLKHFSKKITQAKNRRSHCIACAICRKRYKNRRNRKHLSLARTPAEAKNFQCAKLSKHLFHHLLYLWLSLQILYALRLYRSRDYWRDRIFDLKNDPGRLNKMHYPFFLHNHFDREENSTQLEI